jgi:hypothetical protein
LIGEAVNVTDDPVHTGLEEAPTETLTGNDGLTVIVTGVEVAGFGDGQLAFEVRFTVTASLFDGI